MYVRYPVPEFEHEELKDREWNAPEYLNADEQQRLLGAAAGGDESAWGAYPVMPDDALMEAFFEAGDLTDEQLRDGLRKAVAGRNIFPVLYSSALNAIAVEPVLDAIVEGFESLLLLLGCERIDSDAVLPGLQLRQSLLDVAEIRIQANHRLVGSPSPFQIPLLFVCTAQIEVQ